MDIISILQAWIKAQFLKCLSITQAESNLPDAYKKKGVRYFTQICQVGRQLKMFSDDKIWRQSNDVIGTYDAI